MENSQEEPLDRNSGEASRPRVELTEKSWIQKVKDKFLPGVRITLLISLIFYLSMFIVGIWGIKKCPANEYIPFFLIVTGGIGLVSKVISIVRETILKQFPVVYVESFFYTVELVFLILGSFWVFKVYTPSYTPSYTPDSRYCNKTVYMFAFTYLAVLYAIVLLIIVCYSCFLGCICFVKRTEINNEDTEASTRPIRETHTQTHP